MDAIGKARSSGRAIGFSNDEREQTLNQLLAEIDGFNTSEGVIIMAATNTPEVLDPALLRAGRFDRQVLVAFESEDRGAVGAVADDGEGDYRHRATVTQWTRQTDGESAAFTRLSGLAPCPQTAHMGVWITKSGSVRTYSITEG